MLTATQSQSPSHQRTGSIRFHALDAARAFALLIGIVHHGIESFVTYAKWDWVTQDSQSSVLLDVVFYISHIFRMQAFFLMAGFFAHLLYHRRGLRGFVNNRFQRLVLPFLLFWPILYAIDWKLWVLGIQRVSGLSEQQAVAKLPAYMVWANGFPLMHLWFLYFLILFCVGVVLIRPVFNHWIDASQRIRLAVDRTLGSLLAHCWGSLALGLIMVGPMLGMTDWFGVDTSASGLVPRWPSFLVYGAYFCLGWVLHRQPHLMDRFHTFRAANLVISVLLTTTLISINLLGTEPTTAHETQLVLAGINTLYSFASMTMVSAFIGYTMAFFTKPNARIRYLADSAYWGYLIHLPIIAFFQIIVAPYNWSWPLKLLCIFAPSCLLVWATYHFGVRNTWLGVLLNGRKQDTQVSQPRIDDEN